MSAEPQWIPYSKRKPKKEDAPDGEVRVCYRDGKTGEWRVAIAWHTWRPLDIKGSFHWLPIQKLPPFPKTKKS